MNRLIAFFVEKRLFADLLTISVIVVGLACVVLIRREVFPTVAFDVITVSTVFPGASAEEAEKLITSPLEQDLREVDGIKKMESKSIEGRSFLLIQLDPDQTTEDKAKADIQDIVDRFELPQLAQTPIVTSATSKMTPIIEVSLGGEMPALELREAARALEKKIESLPGVARVVTRGFRDKEVRVEADPKLLSRYRLTLDDLVNALKRQNVSISAGTIESDPLSVTDRERIVRTVGEFRDLKDIENTVIRANEMAEPIRIRQVAKVFFDLQRPSILTHTNGVPALGLTVLKKEKADAISLVDDLKSMIDGMRPQLDSRLQISFINDLSLIIRRRISVLRDNLALGLILVFVMLALLLQARVAAIVALGISFAFLATMIVFYNSGQSINLISLIGLIIVSGMLVDDAIVVTDNAVRLMEEGKDPKTAAIEGTQQIWPAVTASVLTTVIAFLPMAFMSGIFGKFVKQIPMGVILALLFSMGESFFALPAHIAHFIRIQKKGDKTVRRGWNRVVYFFNDLWERTVVPRYKSGVRFAVGHRYLVCFGMLLLFAGTAFVGLKKSKFILFPPEGIETFFIRMEAPRGFSLSQTEQLVRPVEKLVAALPKEELNDYVTYIGLHQQDANDPNTRRGTEYAQIAVFMSPPENRTRTVPEVIESLRGPVSEIKDFGRVTFERVNPGPPVGKPVNLSVRATQYPDIMAAVSDVKAVLAAIPGVTDIQDSYTLGKEELVVRVRAAEAAAAGVSAASIGSTLRAAYEGIEATTIRGLDEEVQVRVSLPLGARSESGTLGDILIPNMAGQLIPLFSVARIEKSQSLSLYEHENNEREVQVTAQVNTEVSSSAAANAAFSKQLPEILKKHPRVRVVSGGEDVDTQESLNSLMRAFILAAIGVFLVLVFTFQKLIQPLLVLLTLPLGIVSVVLTFILHGKPLSFMAMLGVVALAGVIVNNAIILIDFVNYARAQGTNRFDSIVEAAEKRIRPIFLTTMTTVAGLMPTAYGIGGSDPFVVPIALALGWGLFFGSLLTLFVFPAAIAVLDDLVEVAQKTGRKFKRTAASSALPG